MELILERELDHQQKAIDAIISVLNGITMIKPHLAYENPTFDRKELRLIQNINEVQKNIRADYRGCRDDGDYLTLILKWKQELVKPMYIPKPSMKCIKSLALTSSLLLYHLFLSKQVHRNLLMIVM